MRFDAERTKLNQGGNAEKCNGQDSNGRRQIVIAKLDEYGVLGPIQTIFDRVWIRCVRAERSVEYKGQSKKDERRVDEYEFGVDVNRSSGSLEAGDKSAKDYKVSSRRNVRMARVTHPRKVIRKRKDSTPP